MLSLLKASFLSYSKGCELIVDRAGRFTYIGKSKLKITNVETEDKGNYTCTLSFNLGGVTGSVSETSDVSISGKSGYQYLIVRNFIPVVHDVALCFPWWNHLFLVSFLADTHLLVNSK